ncbi:hypothetical protein VP1G_09461 [Cytospora mali]|uniref:Uncharacterized protein n=1 Tax=Cytospora mali TaxID=578113 RepID=A0A194VEM9_CYTMA|nr:hypothetical protein VP1G_09461 [Valsa mali var. pyri (nom. inval.)]
MASRGGRHNRLFDVDIDLSEFSFSSLRRDTTGDFVPSPDIDLTNIAATLAVGPGPGIQCYHTGSASPGWTHKRSASLRKTRPHRDEHVKRMKMSCDVFGGQDSKTPPSAVVFSANPTQQQPLATKSKTTKANDGQNNSSGHGFLSQLCDIVGVIIKEMLIGKASHA